MNFRDVMSTIQGHQLGSKCYKYGQVEPGVNCEQGFTQQPNAELADMSFYSIVTVAKLQLAN